MDNFGHPRDLIPNMKVYPKTKIIGIFNSSSDSIAPDVRLKLIKMMFRLLFLTNNLLLDKKNVTQI